MSGNGMVMNMIVEMYDVALSCRLTSLSTPQHGQSAQLWFSLLRAVNFTPVILT